MLNSRTARRFVSVITLVLIVGLTSAACGSDSIPGAMGGGDHDMGTMGQDGGDMGMTDAATQMMVTGRDADVMFVQQMIPHHQQAVVMADLALDPTHQASPAVQELARGIKAAQTTEIADMRTWLKEWGATDTSGDMGMDDSGMGMGMGMMSDAAMTKLESAQGADFDRLWLEGMIVHHDGALTMAAHMGERGDDARVQTLTTNIAQSQAAEIAEMRKLLAQ